MECALLGLLYLVHYVSTVAMKKLSGKPRTDTKLLTIVTFVVHWHRNQDEVNFIKVKVMV